eukprot:11418567-Ditylum_brightwellii.AAC.1
MKSSDISSFPKVLYIFEWIKAAEISSKTTAEQQGLHYITISFSGNDIEGTDCISIANGSISNTSTLNVLLINAIIAAAAGGIVIVIASTSFSHNNSQTMSSSHGQGNIQYSSNATVLFNDWLYSSFLATYKTMYESDSNTTSAL